MVEPMHKVIGGKDFERRKIVVDSFAGLKISLGAAGAIASSGGRVDKRGGPGAGSGIGGGTHHAGTTVFTWGMGYQGQLGAKFRRGDMRCRPRPTEVALPPDVTAIKVACGGFHTAVLTDDGRVFSWGEGKHGQLGYSCVAQQDTPMPVAMLSELRVVVSHLACGRHHTVVTDTKGSLWAWGCGKQGQLGDGERSVRREEPEKIKKHNTDSGRQDFAGTTQFFHVSCGARSTFAQATDGRVFSFGAGKQGQLGVSRLPGHRSRCGFLRKIRSRGSGGDH